MQDGERPDDGIEYPHHLLLFGQQGAERAHIGPDSHEARVSQGEQPGKAVDEVEGQSQDGVDEDELDDVNLIVADKSVAFHQPEGSSDQQDEQDVGESGEVQAHQIFSFRRSPSRPVGLTTSTNTSRTKAKASR